MRLGILSDVNFWAGPSPTSEGPSPTSDENQRVNLARIRAAVGKAEKLFGDGVEEVVVLDHRSTKQRMTACGYDHLVKITGCDYKAFMNGCDAVLILAQDEEGWLEWRQMAAQAGRPMLWMTP